MYPKLATGGGAAGRGRSQSRTEPASPISVIVTAPVEDLLQIQEPEWMNVATI